MRRNKVAFYGTLTAAVVTLIHLAHGISHLAHGVPLASWQWVYTTLIIFVAPVVAAVLLWGRFARAGAWLLMASMAGSLAFGVLFHYLASSPDNAFTLQPGAWRVPFVVTAILVSLSEAVGVAVGAWAVSKEVRRAPDHSPRVS